MNRFSFICSSLLSFGHLLQIHGAIAAPNRSRPPAYEVRSFTVGLSHGYSDLESSDLGHLSVSPSSLFVGADTRYWTEAGFGLNLDFSVMSNSKGDSFFSPNVIQSRFRQVQWRTGIAKRWVLWPHLFLLPELGIAGNRVAVRLMEGEFGVSDTARNFGPYLSFGAALWAGRMFFEFVAQYSQMRLKMDELGVDERVEQKSGSVSLGLAI